MRMRIFIECTVLLVLHPVSKSLGRPGKTYFLLSPFYGSDVPAYTSVLAWHIAWHQKVSSGGLHQKASPPRCTSGSLLQELTSTCMSACSLVSTSTFCTSSGG